MQTGLAKQYNETQSRINDLKTRIYDLKSQATQIKNDIQSKVQYFNTCS